MFNLPPSIYLTQNVGDAALVRGCRAGRSMAATAPYSIEHSDPLDSQPICSKGFHNSVTATQATELLASTTSVSLFIYGLRYFSLAFKQSVGVKLCMCVFEWTHQVYLSQVQSNSTTVCSQIQVKTEFKSNKAKERRKKKQSKKYLLPRERENSNPSFQRQHNDHR